MGSKWLAPLAMLYGIGVSVRNKIFDWGIVRSRKYDIPVICVGNITVGGTGKTPVTEMLISHFAARNSVAVLSRGYRRRTKGYVEARVDSPFLEVGDEPKQIKRKFPEIVVAVCEKRTEGIERIRADHPEVDLILLDDGFQHRWVEPWVNILLMDYNRPVCKDHLLPWGSLRDTRSQMKRAHYVIVTKCPEDMTPIDRRITQKSLNLFPYQSLFFTATQYGNLKPVFPLDTEDLPEKGSKIIAMSGIANPEPFHKALGRRFDMVKRMVYSDHYTYRRKDLQTMEKALDGAPEGTVIVMTEKDAVKFAGSRKIPPHLRVKLFYMPIKISFREDTRKEFLNKLDYDIRTNPSERILRT
ncbi:MAG: tetraacyldisaccharide 4'-kinase [Rikenellaceae bacterium]|nr:tetraacyldisaccharide 4'-kinase [Rikenellaceae bacterium]